MLFRSNLVTIMAPFVMHDSLKSELQHGVPEQIKQLLVWLRVLVMRSIDQSPRAVRFMSNRAYKSRPIGYPSERKEKG